MKKDRVTQEMERCVHFTGIQHDACSAGVRYSSVRIKPAEGRPQWPCINMECDNCPSRKLLTREEAEAEIAKDDKAISDAMSAYDAVATHAAGRLGIRDSIDCPICKTGKLHYTVASINGHIHAACTTNGCVSWMQ